MTVTVGVLRAGRYERRVALVPADARTLADAGLTVLVEAGAGKGAWFGDDEYTAAGAVVAGADEVLDRAGALLTVGGPPARVARPGLLLIGLFTSARERARAVELARAGVRVLDLAGLPRTLSRAQPMDALTSQASIAGYRAVLLAASTLFRYFPMMVSAAGTAPPTRVLVLGAGVAGLQAIATARRLGAVVHAYDVRAAARDDAASVGATVLTLDGADDAADPDGYARRLTADAGRELRDALTAQIPRFDVVITTAQVRNGPPPLLVTGEAVKSMRPGSVVVDLAAGPDGGNVALTEPGRTVVTDGGVTVIGAGDLAGTMPTAASVAYSRNVGNLLRHVLRDGAIVLDPADEIVAGTLVAADPPGTEEATA